MAQMLRAFFLALIRCVRLAATSYWRTLRSVSSLWSWRRGSRGRPSVGMDLQVTDESGKQVEVGKPGELVARGAIMRGYWNNPEETELAFRNGSFRTVDIGYQDSQGYFYILDRLENMIVTGGEIVYSGEVKAAIYQHPAVPKTLGSYRDCPRRRGRVEPGSFGRGSFDRIV